MSAIHEADSGSSEPSPEKAAPDDDDDSYAPEGFDEIENAFAQVSMVADALLESIEDDDLRGKERKQERQASRRNMSSTSPRRGKASNGSSRSPTNYVTDSDDDIHEDQVVQNHTQSFYEHHRTPDVQEHHANHYAASPYEGHASYGHHDESDISTLGEMSFVDGDESMDGSLLNDVANLKSITRAMRAEIAKQEEAFHANVTEGNPQTFFQKLEDAKAAEEAKTPKIKNNLPPARSKMGGPARPTTISVRNGKQGLLMPVIRTSKTQKPKGPSLLEQLRRVCNQLFGKKPSLPLLAANMLIWLCFFKLGFMAKQGLMDGEGRLRPAFAAVDV